MQWNRVYSVRPSLFSNYPRSREIAVIFPQNKYTYWCTRKRKWGETSYHIRLFWYFIRGRTWEPNLYFSGDIFFQKGGRILQNGLPEKLGIVREFYFDEKKIQLVQYFGLNSKFKFYMRKCPIYCTGCYVTYLNNFNQ